MSQNKREGRLTIQEAEAQGFTVDNSRHIGYKRAPFAPSEWVEVFTELETVLLEALESLKAQYVALATRYYAQLGDKDLLSASIPQDSEEMRCIERARAAIAKAKGLR